MATEEELFEKKDHTFPDALTNLFVGLFAGSVLFSIQKIHFFEINPFKFNNFLLLMIELIYLIYLVFGYFTLFRVYHRDSLFYKKNYSVEHKKLIKRKFTALVLVVSFLAMLPHSFSAECFMYFYPTLCLILIFDCVWTSSYIRLHKKEKIINEISMGYVFDVLGIILSLFTFTVLYEWKFGTASNLFSEIVFMSIVSMLHLAFFFPFAALYLRRNQ